MTDRFEVVVVQIGSRKYDLGKQNKHRSIESLVDPAKKFCRKVVYVCQSRVSSVGRPVHQAH